MVDSDIRESHPLASRSLRRRASARKVFLRVHQVIGLFAGAVVVLVGLSGSLLAFREDIDEWLNAPIMRVDAPPQSVYRPLDEILAAAQAAMPEGGKAERLTLPRHARAAASIGYMLETDDLDTYAYEMFVDPYTAKVTGQRMTSHGDSPLSQPFIPMVMAFHWTLLLGANKAYLIGTVAILLSMSILAGLYLWWPANGAWRLGLKVKWGASPERVVYDLHKSVGAYAALLLLIMLFTGVAMIFKPQTRSLVSLISPVRADPDFGRSAPAPGRSADRSRCGRHDRARSFPEGRLHWVLLPSSPAGVYIVGEQSRVEPNRTKTYRNVGIDQYSGHVLHVQDRQDFTAGERLLEWLYPLHAGEAFGAPGRALAALIGVTPFVLYVTGFVRWRQKRRARKESLR